jgi:hypothetical protein
MSFVVSAPIRGCGEIDDLAGRLSQAKLLRYMPLSRLSHTAVKWLSGEERLEMSA